METRLLTSGAKAGNAVAEFVVPDGVAYRVLYGHTTMATDATVANRQLSFGIYDDAASPALVFDTHAGATVPASQTGRHFELMPGTYRETAFVSTSLQVPIPVWCVVRSGHTIRVTIGAGVAGDSHTTNLVVEVLR